MSHAEDTTLRNAKTDHLPRLAHDKLISIADIRLIFKLGRTAAYELTRRPGFPDCVEISPRCHRWWASEVSSFAETLRRAHRQDSKRHYREPRPPDLIPSLKITGTVRAIRERTARS